MVTTFKQIQKLIISSILLLSLMIAGCSTEQNVYVSNQERGIEAQSDKSDTDIARRETQSGEDETQDQVNDALTSLSAQGSYMSPEGENNIKVNIEIDENNIVQSAEVILDESSSKPTSQGYTEQFNRGIEESVVGKSLESVESPERVNGSSLTSIGFNEALEKIREERLQ